MPLYNRLMQHHRADSPCSGSRCCVFNSDEEELEEMENINHGISTKREFRIVVMGPNGVGKSALVVRYLTRRYIGDYDSTSEAIYTHHTTIDGKDVILHIMDTTWRHGEKDFQREQVRWGDGFLLVYDITNRNSFEAVKVLLEEIRDIKKQNRVPVAIIGNKCDLLHRRVVNEEEGGALAEHMHCLFLETSASESLETVINAFSVVYRDMKMIHRKIEKLKRFMQKPAVSARLHLRQSLKMFTEKHWRERTSTI